MEERYVCHVCGRKYIKLWRPYAETEPLICAICAEKRQVPVSYNEIIWYKRDGRYIKTFTGKKIELDEWTVDEKGTVPVYDGPGPEDSLMMRTDVLKIGISDISEVCLSKSTDMVPAILNEKGDFFKLGEITEEIKETWTNLPTK